MSYLLDVNEPYYVYIYMHCVAIMFYCKTCLEDRGQKLVQNLKVVSFLNQACPVHSVKSIFMDYQNAYNKFTILNYYEIK